MSSMTFKGEAWTIAKQPTHKVIAAHGRIAEVVGYFIAEDKFEVSIAMDVFVTEYEGEYDRLVAVECTEEVKRYDPAICGRISILELLKKSKAA